MIDESKLRNFVSHMNASYEEKTVLNTFSHVNQFDPEKHGSKSYIQIGRRHNLPKRFFYKEDNYHNLHLAENFADSIVTGEQVYIAESCIESSKVRSLNVGDIPDFEDLLTACRDLANPDHLFVPIHKEFYKRVNEWIQQYGSFSGDYETVTVGSSEMKIRWLSTDSGLRSIVAVDSGYTPIVQKYGGQAEEPSGLDIIEKYSEFSEGNRLICTFGEYDEPEGEEEEFDFLYRSVFSEPQLTEYSASVIEIPDTLELTS